MRANVNFNYLESFIMVSKTKSFSLAAKELNVAQPVISKQIKLLEAHLGHTLFKRTRKEILLTPEGQRFLNKIKGPFHQLCGEIETFNGEVTEISGPLHFATYQEIGERAFLPLLTEFIKKYPGIKLHIEFLRGVETEEQLRKGQVDVAILDRPFLHENFKSYEILKEEIVLVANKDTAKKKIDSVSDLPFIAYRHNDPLINFYLKQNAPRSRIGNLDIRCSANSHKAMRHLLYQLPYYAVLPKLSVQKDLEEKRLIAVGPVQIFNQLYIIQRDQEIEDPRASLLRQFLQGKK